MAEFFDMGGYAGFVWPSYAASVLALAGLTVYVVWRNARVRDELARLQEAKAPSAVAERRGVAAQGSGSRAGGR